MVAVVYECPGTPGSILQSFRCVVLEAGHNGIEKHHSESSTERGRISSWDRNVGSHTIRYRYSPRRHRFMRVPTRHGISA